MSESNATARKREPHQARGRFIWAGSSEHDALLGEVYDNGQPFPEEMAQVWAASYCTMFPALARIRDLARLAVGLRSHALGPKGVEILTDIERLAAEALPVPTIGDLNGTSPVAPERAPSPAGVADLTGTAKRIALAYWRAMDAIDDKAAPNVVWDAGTDKLRAAWLSAARAVSAPAVAPEVVQDPYAGVTERMLLDLTKAMFDAPTMEAGYAILADWAWQCGHGKPAALAHSADASGGGVLDLAAFVARQKEFSERTFGPGTRAKGVVAHIRKELGEIEADPTDLTEWVDVVLLALDGAWRAGFTPQQIAAGMDAKLTRNENRVWPDWRTMSEDAPIEHVRSAPPAQQEG